MPRKKKNCSENHRPGSMSTNKEKPVQRNAANARERARMRVLSRAFCRLKTTLPWVPADTKLSKLDTLRLAASYIAHLKGILRDDPFGPEDPIHPAMNLTWPFGFNRGGGNGSGGGGSGSEDEEEDAESGSSCGWEEVTKDCVHLDQEQDPSLVRHTHLDSTSAHLHHHPHHHHHRSPHHLHHDDSHPQHPFNSQTDHHNHHNLHLLQSNPIMTTGVSSSYRDDLVSVG